MKKIVILTISFWLLISCSNNTTSKLPYLSYEDKKNLISFSYQGIYDFFLNKKEKVWPEKFNNINNRVYSVIWENGVRKGSWYTQTNNLAETVYSTIQKNLKNNNIKNSKSLMLHIFIMGNYKPYDDKFERGIHGIRFECNKNKNYYSSYSIEGNYKTQKLLKKYKKKSCEIYYFDSIHFAKTRFSDKIITFYRGNTPKLSPGLSFHEFNNSLNIAVDWITSNLNNDGYFNYLYNPSNGTYSKNNNMIRQHMASRILAELSQSNKKLIAKHKKNLNYIFNNWYKEENGKGYIIYKNKSKLGGIAIALRTLTYSPFFNKYKDKAEKLAKTILYLQNNSGSFEPWYRHPTGYRYDKNRLLTFYSGEAILALVEYFIKTGNKKYLNAAIKSQNFYIDRYITNINKNYYPAYVPWHTLSLNKLYKITKNLKYADAIFTLNDKLLEIQNTNGLPYNDFLGRFYNPDTPQFGTPHSSSDAVYTEGLAYAYEIAVILNDNNHINKYKNAIMLGIHNLRNLQYKDSNMYFMKYPERVKGALRFNVNDNRIRVDTTQHMIDAFQQISKVLKKEDFSQEKK